MHHISCPTSRNSTGIFSASRSNQETSEDRLYDLIITKQSDRLDDQRSELGGRPPQPCSTLPIELPDDVTELIVAMQAGRYESQRAYLKVSP